MDHTAAALVQSSNSKIDLSDGLLFGNDAGEDEAPEVLNSYFVDQPSFKQFLSRSNLFRVARSRKGMGKSALISKMAYDLREDDQNKVVLVLTGASLMAVSPPPKDASHLEFQNYWSKVMCSRINYALAASLGFQFSDTNLAILDNAEMAGFREKNLIFSLLSRIKSSKIPIEITSISSPNQEELLKRALEKNSDKSVWLLVDDIDSTYVNTENQQYLVSSFFSACRALVRDVKGLRIRASVRTDVWTNLRKNEDLDKCEQYIDDISWSSGDLKIILSKKIFAYCRRSADTLPLVEGKDYRTDADSILECAFERRMRWGQGNVPPFRPIYILSAGRPRWMAQLCRFAGVKATKLEKTKVGIGEINSIMKTYSRFRLGDIYKEHSHQYPALEKLIETFSNSPARYNTTDLVQQIAKCYINLVGHNNIPAIDGVAYKYPVQLAHFLYKIGFIVGRREHGSTADLANFVRFEERPELLVYGANPDDGMLWEVHPSYRTALSIGLEKRSADGAERQRAEKVEAKNGNIRRARRRRRRPATESTPTG